MRKIIITVLSFLVIFTLYAQPPQGGRRGGGEKRSHRPPMDRSSQSGEKLWLSNFPEIPDLTLEQREKLGSALSKEIEGINKEMKKKEELINENNNDLDISDSDIEKNNKKIKQIDEKINKTKDKTNKKVQSFLSVEQYQIFIEKRDEFKFRKMDRNRNRPREGERPVRPQNEEQLPQGNPMFMQEDL